MSFSIVSCSAQDFATRMAYYDSFNVRYGMGDRASDNMVYARFAANIHAAMGYRADHGNLDLEF
jgi:hypothetical protein